MYFRAFRVEVYSALFCSIWAMADDLKIITKRLLN